MRAFAWFQRKPNIRRISAALCSVFSLCALFQGSLIIECAQIHSFRVCLSAYWGKKAKARFCLFRVIILRAPHSPFLQKRFRANTGALTQKRGFACASNYWLSAKSFWADKMISSELRATPPFKRFRVFCGVFSLFFALLKAHILSMAKNSPFSQKPYVCGKLRALGKKCHFCPRI